MATRLIIKVLTTAPDSPQFLALAAAYATQDQAAMKSPVDKAAKMELETEVEREQAEEERQQAVATAAQRSIEKAAAQKAKEDALLAQTMTAKVAAHKEETKRKCDMEAGKKDAKKNAQVRQSAAKLDAAYAKAEAERPSVSVISDDEGAGKPPRRSSSEQARNKLVACNGKWGAVVTIIVVTAVVPGTFLVREG